ncbi:MAG: type II toxin-antitoxin system VapC family toxin [Endomicrobia bacterium]|nr:type II toxin-antitoxin system VapC family toxin [Endomicrobiia bacterium]
MYLLDTNICIYIINKRPVNIVNKLNSLKPNDVKLSSVSIAELEYGIAKSMHKEQNRHALIGFSSAFDIIPFDDMDAQIYGEIRADLEKRGKIIGPYDLQIAAQAICRNLILVTNNTKEFKRISGLKLENWSSA